MPNLDDQQWQAWLAQRSPTPPAAPDAAPAQPPATEAAATNGAPSLLPLTREELAARATRAQTIEQGRPRAVEQLPGAPQDFATRMGARPGVPFDTTSGVPLFQKLRLDWQPTQADKVAMLEQVYPGKVRTNDLGWPIVEFQDEQGRPRDVLAEPTNINWEDTTKLLTQIPEMAGVLGTLYLTKGRTLGPGVLNALATLGLTTAGAAAGSTIKDALVREARGADIQPGEIAARRGMEAAENLALGPLVGGTGFLLTRGISPFSQPGPLQAAARQGRAALIARHGPALEAAGIGLEMTPAEATGSPLLAAVEAQEAQKPGSKAAFQQFFAQRRREIRGLRDIIMGGPAPEEEAVGEQLLKTVGAKTAPSQFEISRLASQVADQAEAELRHGAGQPVNKVNLGIGTRSRAFAMRDAMNAQTDQLYGVIERNPLTQSKNIPMDDIAAQSGAMYDRLPSTERQVSIVSPIRGPTGAPITTTQVQRELVNEFLEPGIAPKLRALRDMGDQHMRLDELMRMRSTVRQEIAVGKAVPGWKAGDLSNIEDMLSDKIRNGLRDLDPQLLADWERANTQYAVNASRLERTGIAELFRDPKQPSYLSDEDIVQRALTDNGTYQAYRDFFGANSPQVLGVHQAIRDDVLQRSSLNPTVNARQFINNLEALDQRNPDLIDEVFGAGNARRLRSSAMAKIASEMTDMDELPKAELDQLLRPGNNLSAQSLVELRAAQAKQKDLFRNDLLRAISKGNLDPEQLNPHEIVSKFVFNESTQPKDVQGLMYQLINEPQLRDDLRRVTFNKVLDKATRLAPTGEQMLDANKLEEFLSNANTSARLREVLGRDTFADLNALKDFLKPGAAIGGASKSAGGLVGGSQIASMVEKGELSYVGRAIKNFILATVYTRPELTAWARNTALSADDKAALLNLFVTSTPFLRAAAMDKTEQGQKDMAVAIRQARQRFGNLNGAGGGAGAAVAGRVTGNLSEEEWNRWMQQQSPSTNTAAPTPTQGP